MPPFLDRPPCYLCHIHLLVLDLGEEKDFGSEVALAGCTDRCLEVAEDGMMIPGHMIDSVVGSLNCSCLRSAR